MAPASSTDQLGAAQQRRGFWLRMLHQWHWISSAVCLIGMLLFTVTGLTLNHAARIEATPSTEHRTLTLPTALLQALGTRQEGNAPLPPRVAQWLGRELDISVGTREGEWSPEEIYLALPRPGGDAWLSLDRSTGAV